MKTCVNCNTLCDDNIEYCPKCGYHFAEIQDNIENQENKKKENEEIDTCQNSPAEPISSEKQSFSKDADNHSDIPDKKGQELLAAPTSDQDSDTTPKHRFHIRTVCEIFGAVLLVLFLIIATIKNSELNTLQKKYTEAQTQLEEANAKVASLTADNLELTQTNDALTSKNDELENGAAKQLVDIKNAYEAGDWETVISLADTLHTQYNGSAEDQEAQELASASQAKIDEANAAKAAEDAQGYETGITYDQLARTPDDYMGKKVKFYGKVVQVIEGDSIQIRLAVDDNYDTILLGEYSKDIVSSRVLEDDYITIYGTSVGTISYKSTMGGTITIPGVYIDKIDQ